MVMGTPQYMSPEQVENTSIQPEKTKKPVEQPDEARNEGTLNRSFSLLKTPSWATVKKGGDPQNESKGKYRLLRGALGTAFPGAAASRTATPTVPRARTSTLVFEFPVHKKKPELQFVDGANWG